MKFFIQGLLSVTFFINGYAQLQVASVFGDHMVLQRDMTIPVWGEVTPNSSVSVSFNGKIVRAKAGGDGRWAVKIPACHAGGPYTMAIQGKEKIILNDIYVGEVWLCSGQSNMDMTVAREDRYWCGVNNEKEE